MKKITAIAILIIVVAMFAGCVPPPPPEKIRESGTVVKTIEIEDYGQGIYYFPYSGRNFGYSLSDFKSRHPELELATIAVATSSDGGTSGYFVVFHAKQ